MSDIEAERQVVRELCAPGSHDNIVSVLRQGQLTSSYFFMDMELLDINLAAYIASNWLPTSSEDQRPPQSAISPSQRMERAWEIMRRNSRTRDTGALIAWHRE